MLKNAHMAHIRVHAFIPFKVFKVLQKGIDQDESSYLRKILRRLWADRAVH